eukprot:m.724678 g.724678  ORF g.724678 m.724678 type:complete len:54 (-) comp58838_c0_seq1:1-162(-)
MQTLSSGSEQSSECVLVPVPFPFCFFSLLNFSGHQLTESEFLTRLLILHAFLS